MQISSLAATFGLGSVGVAYVYYYSLLIMYFGTNSQLRSVRINVMARAINSQVFASLEAYVTPPNLYQPYYPY